MTKRPAKAYLVDRRPVCPSCTSSKVRVWQSVGVLRLHPVVPLSFEDVIDYDHRNCASEGVYCSECKTRIYRSY